MTKLTVTGTGDSLFVARFPEEYAEQIGSVADFIKSCDIRMTNLETNLSDFQFYGNQYSGGTWLNTRSKYIEELFRYGFHYFGNANNHCMDYSYGGMLSTIDVLESYGMHHSGTGRSLEDAAKPAIIEANGLKTAVFAVDASFNKPSMAGKATHFLKARPGVNYLRHDTVYKVDEAEMASLKSIAAKTHINFTREREIATGFLTPDPEGYFFLGDKKFSTKTDVPSTKCNTADLARITGAIRTAKESCDYVFLLVHCHNSDNVAVVNPPEYLKEFAHACIDAGASAIFGGGCHQLRPMELYKGFPIFYSLGDFIYQGLLVEYLPADFMEQYSIDIYSTAEQALYARSRGNKVGLHCSKKNYQTILPKLEFEGGKMTAMQLMPVYLNFDRKDEMNGLPIAAHGAEAAEILDIMNTLSNPYGVKLMMENDMITATTL